MNLAPKTISLATALYASSLLLGFADTVRSFPRVAAQGLVAGGGIGPPSRASLGRGPDLTGHALSLLVKEAEGEATA